MTSGIGRRCVHREPYESRLLEFSAGQNNIFFFFLRGFPYIYKLYVGIGEAWEYPGRAPLNGVTYVNFNKIECFPCSKHAFRVTVKVILHYLFYGFYIYTWLFLF